MYDAVSHRAACGWSHVHVDSGPVPFAVTVLTAPGAYTDNSISELANEDDVLSRLWLVRQADGRMDIFQRCRPRRWNAQS